MNQVTSISNAITVQTSRVDAIRRSLLPISAKLHHLVDDTSIAPSTKSARIEKAARTFVDKHGVLYTDESLPDVMRQVTNLTTGLASGWLPHMDAIRLKGHEDVPLLPDGVSTAMLGHPTFDQIAAQGEAGKQTSIRLAINILLDEMGILSKDVTFINSDILDLVAHASHSLDEEPLRTDDLIAPSGFCFFEKPLIVNGFHPTTGDIRDDVLMGWRAFSWQTGETGVTFTIYSDYSCFRYIYLPSLEHVLGEPQSDLYSMISAWRDEDIFPVDITFWRCDRPWLASTESAEQLQDGIFQAHIDNTTPTVSLPTSTFRKLFLTIMRFCWQEILISEPAELPRQLRRSTARKVGDGLQINMLRLRRIKRSSTSVDCGDGHRLDHRLVVRGHWRNHHYPSMGPAYTDDGSYNPESHRRIWIDPHVKGPDDAPFVFKHKVNALVR